MVQFVEVVKIDEIFEEFLCLNVSSPHKQT